MKRIYTNLTIPELQDRLANLYNEVDLLELLKIDSFELVERFEDKIENYYEDLIQEVQEDIDADEQI